jgi:hypothetical protein
MVERDRLSQPQFADDAGYRRVAVLRKKLRRRSGQFSAVYKVEGDTRVRVEQYGPTRPEWYERQARDIDKSR